MATLIITGGPATGQQFALEDHRLVLIGRDEKCTFQILDEQISRRHMQVRLNEDGEGHSAIDFGSSNGVFINDNRITDETQLTDGDAIRLGATEFVYSAIDSPDAKTISQIMRKRGEYMRGTIAES